MLDNILQQPCQVNKIKLKLNKTNVLDTGIDSSKTFDRELLLVKVRVKML